MDGQLGTGTQAEAHLSGPPPLLRSVDRWLLPQPDRLIADANDTAKASHPSGCACGAILGRLFAWRLNLNKAHACVR